MSATTSGELPLRMAPTALGEIAIWGDFARFSADRPLVLVIRGVFAGPRQSEAFAGEVPEADMVFTHLPGMNSPYLRESTVPAIAAAFEEMMAGVFPGRGYLKLGISVGGLAAMAMKGGASTLALDTPLSTAPLWMVRDRVRTELTKGASAAFRNFAWNLLGMDEHQVVNRDFRGLAAATPWPLTFMIAKDPLEPERPVDRTPGLISAEDREFLSSLPKMRRVWAEDSGHDLILTTPDGVARETRFALARGGLI